MAGQRGQLIALDQIPQITPFKPAQIFFARLGPKIVERTPGKTVVAILNSARGVADVGGVKFKAGCGGVFFGRQTLSHFTAGMKIRPLPLPETYRQPGENRQGKRQRQSSQ